MRFTGIMNKINAVERRITDSRHSFTSSVSIEHLLEKYKITDAERNDDSELSRNADKKIDEVLAHAKEWRERRR